MTEDKSFVDLVLERMDTNPEEFVENTEKFRWATLVRALYTHAKIPADPTGDSTMNLRTRSVIEWALDKEEMDALTAKFREVYRAHLKKDYLKHILAGSETEYRYANKKPSSILAPSTMRAEAERVLRQAIDKEAQEGNWGAVSAINTVGRNYT